MPVSVSKQPQRASQQQPDERLFVSTSNAKDKDGGSKKNSASGRMSLHEACRLLRSNDESLTALNVNHCQPSTPGISNEAGDFIIDDGWWSELASSLSYSRRLLDLDLSNTSISYGGVDALSRAIGANRKSSLQSLNFSWNHIGPDGARPIARHIISRSCPPGLRDLNLCGAAIGDGGMANLALALEANTCPRLTLDVGHNNIGALGISHLAAAFSRGNLTNLRHLDLSHNSIGNNGMTDLAEGISEGFTAKGEEMILASLHVRHNRIKKQGAISIANHILQAPVRGLASLDLSHNALSDRGVEAIGNAIAKSPTSSNSSSVRELYLEGVGMGRLGLVAMTTCIRQAPALVTLDLSDNKLTDAHARDLAHALRDRRSFSSSIQPLDCLYLRHNKIHKSGALAVVSAMHSAPLVRLDLSENPIGSGSSSHGDLDGAVGRELIGLLESQEEERRRLRSQDGNGAFRCLTSLGLDDDVIQDSSVDERVRQMLRRNHAELREQLRGLNHDTIPSVGKAGLSVAASGGGAGGGDDDDDDKKKKKSSIGADDSNKKRPPGRGPASDDPYNQPSRKPKRLHTRRYLKGRDDVGRFVHELALRLIPSTNNDALPQCPRFALLVPYVVDHDANPRRNSLTMLEGDNGGLMSKCHPSEDGFFMNSVRRFFSSLFVSGQAASPATDDNSDEDRLQTREMQLHLFCEDSLMPLSDSPIILSLNPALKASLAPIVYMTALVVEMLSPELGRDDEHVNATPTLEHQAKKYVESCLEPCVCEELFLAIQNDQDVAAMTSSSSRWSDTLLQLMEKAYQTLVDIAISTEHCTAWRRHLRVVIDYVDDACSIEGTSNRRRPLWINKEHAEKYRAKRRAQAAAASNKHTKPLEPSVEETREALKLATELAGASAPCELPPSFISHLTQQFSNEFKMDLDGGGLDLFPGPMEVFHAVDKELEKSHYGQYRVKRVRSDLSADLLSEHIPMTVETACEMLHREMVVLSHYKHPNLPKLVGIGKNNGDSSEPDAVVSSFTSGHLVYTSEGGRQLSRVLADDVDTCASLSWIGRLQVVFDVAKALHHLHASQPGYRCFHRNVQPSSIFVISSQEGTEGPRATLEGLEYSHFASRKKSGNILPEVFDADRPSSRVVGTTGTSYMCPVVQRGEEEYSRNSDVYSLGVVMMELYTGRHFAELLAASPIQDWTAQNMANWAYGGFPKASSISSVATRLEFCDLVLRCVAEDPKARPPIRKIVQWLQDILLQSMDVATDPVPVDSFATRGVTVGNESAGESSSPSFCDVCRSSRQRAVLACSGDSSSGPHYTCVDCLAEDVRKNPAKELRCLVPQCQSEHFTYSEVKSHMPLSALIDHVRVGEEGRTRRLQSALCLLKENGGGTDVSSGRGRVDATTMNLDRSLAALWRLTGGAEDRAKDRDRPCPKLLLLVPSYLLADENADEVNGGSRMLLYFVCEHSFTLVEPPVQVVATKAWQRAMAPLLKVCVHVLRAATSSPVFTSFAPIQHQGGAMSSASEASFSGAAYDLLNAMNKQVDLMFLGDKDVQTALDGAMTRYVVSDEAVRADFEDDSSMRLEVMRSVDCLVQLTLQKKNALWREALSPAVSEDKIVWVKREFVPLYDSSLSARQ